MRVARMDFVDRTQIRDLIRHGVRRLTEVDDEAQAWRSVLQDAQRIAIKFNSVAAETIRTAELFAIALVEELTEAGWQADQLALIEAPPSVARRFGTRTPAAGWGERIMVGDVSEQLANYLLEADAVINVPFLKTHRLAGMSCCLKNISHAVIRQPARHHANGCSPAVAQVVAHPLVSSRLRLNLVNAIRVVADRGPDASEADLTWYGGVLCGLDPVAVDTIGALVLATERRRLNLPANLEVPYLSAAAQMQLGRWHLSEIQRVAVEGDGV
jgi:hypothetical protein